MANNTTVTRSAAAGAGADAANNNKKKSKPYKDVTIYTVSIVGAVLGALSVGIIIAIIVVAVR